MDATPPLELKLAPRAKLRSTGAPVDSGVTSPTDRNQCKSPSAPNSPRRASAGSSLDALRRNSAPELLSPIPTLQLTFESNRDRCTPHGIEIAATEAACLALLAAATLEERGEAREVAEVELSEDRPLAESRASAPPGSAKKALNFVTRKAKKAPRRAPSDAARQPV